PVRRQGHTPNNRASGVDFVVFFPYQRIIKAGRPRPAAQRGEIRMTRLRTFGLALGLSAAFSAGLAGHAAAQVKFAVTGPITGGSAAFGAQIKQGTEQAIEDINAAGGILGQKIVLAGVGDDRADPKEGVSVANKFAADGVKFVIGHFNSGVTIPASEVYQQNGIL